MTAPSAVDSLQSQQAPWPSRRSALLLLLVLAFVRGLVYLVLMPPWQHYDEPTHFEYVRLLAQSRQLPKAGDYDVTMRQEIASSMQAAGFWKGTAPLPISFWSDEPAWLGISELDHPPLYYLVVAIPQLLAGSQAVETQLYLARLVSIVLNLVVVASAFRLVEEIFPGRRWLALGTATFIAWLPPLTDLMSSVNNDVGAAAAASLLLLASVRLIRRGPSLKRGALILVLAVLCLATKSTSGILAVTVLLALILAHIPRAHRRWLWVSLGVLVPVGFLLAITWRGHAAHWYCSSPTAAQNLSPAATPLGHSALLLSGEEGQYTRSVFQELRPSKMVELGESATIGAWIKTAGGSSGYVTLSADDGQHREYHRVIATADWQFHAFRVSIDPEATGFAVRATIPQREGAAQDAYLDGLILAAGDLPLDTAPSFEDDRATRAIWGNTRVTNLLENGSAEDLWPTLRPWIGNSNLFGQPIAAAFHSLLDWSRTRWAYGSETRLLIDSYWGTFGWGHLALPEPILIIFRVLSGLAVLGVGIRISLWIRSGRTMKAWQKRAWFVLGCALFASWVGAFLRIHPLFTTQRIIWPMARYAVAVTVPTAIVLCLGLFALVPTRWRWGAGWVSMLGMALIEMSALLTLIIPYYYG